MNGQFHELFAERSVVKQRMQTGHFASAPNVVRLIAAKEGFKGLFAELWARCDGRIDGVGCNLEILKQPRGLAKKDQVLARVHAALKAAQIVVHMETMLMLESGDMGEFVGNYMIFELVNRLVIWESLLATI
ncbi:hypothetical protein HanPI659440_Chr10g0395511 [Helianthus annuus]|nr:hypothetical protein HanPI659440_Chr10g0395511 [Helianthus annuus]